MPPERPNDTPLAVPSDPLPEQEIFNYLYLAHGSIILDPTARYTITGRAVVNIEQLNRDILGDEVVRESCGVSSY